ncbi:uncharacterized protein LOC106156653 isoform X1 [Lingula anatina]|uniref:Uncharacterized protein LOC106156653 isoform X1 n=1 Tax=Lingula anatina TaxID=7574 RepID=A0A1S3HN04_LINAN|nr:uncharacterized protein LOC106156653 isoform X1 [Lingula anatina]XP_013387449.1 uncharacterized protein LOC106156653 isoform X1 [Lingula anatina]XP_013387450.1 uncharacterized protein LOC106156653 isoform X1 [Lingula anatina]XP_013387451.1 uncharacterized protein LOC106156653 isoform X1 [Lingula anatina]XP_013387452.1 uncharacterized protein LOC106156653 isoform X1 [Lingula anatina]XP_013387453.1 uncharacterized protein LOC106156653 isoform X1 [Lingula anatina]|eukprot:XP_013387448.1 uncharacterized protein LOC106156653 isoform X1 [Lingula anatina]
MQLKIERQLKKYVTDCERAFEEVEKTKDVAVKRLRELAVELEDQQRKMDIVKISAASSGVVGGGLVLTGFGLAFFTFGASLVVTAVGTVVGGTSLLTKAATDIAEVVINSKKMKKAQEALQNYKESFSAASKSISKLKNFVADNKLDTQNLVHNLLARAGQLLKHPVSLLALRVVPSSVMAGRSAVITIKEAVCKGSMSVSEAGGPLIKTLTTAQKIGKVAGATGAVVGIAFDLKDLIETSIKLHKKKHSEVACQLHAKAKSLETSYSA